MQADDGSRLMLAALQGSMHVRVHAVSVGGRNYHHDFMIIDRRCNAGLYLYYELALVQAHLFGWHRLLCFMQRMATGVMELQFGCRREIKFGQMMLQAAMASMRVQAQSPGLG